MTDPDVIKKLVEDAGHRMDGALEATRHDLATIRTGRANPALLDRVEVDAYGGKMPVSQVANINVPEPRMIVITPWDRSVLPAIERAILKSDIGITPNSDGTMIRLVIPTLTEETRKNLIRQVHRRIEEGKVAVRNVRRDVNEQLRNLKKNHELGEDDEKRVEAEVQKLTDRHVQDLDVIQKHKEEELLEV